MRREDSPMILEEPVLRVEHLTVRYGKTCDYCLGGGELVKNTCPHCKSVWAANDVCVELYPGEILGVVGESGSGKSTLMKSLYFDFPVTEGEGYLKSFEEGREEIFSQSMRQKKYIKNHLMGMVYQNPVMGLRMNYSSAGNIAEKLIAAGQRNFSVMNERVDELLDAVEIMKTRRKEPPRNFSGGMQQRVQISKALANHPQILLLDEVTTGLDLSVQVRVLELIRRIRHDFNVSILLVSHDLAVIRMLADRTIVMLDGRIIERGLTDQILEDPQHPYTQKLVHSLI